MNNKDNDSELNPIEKQIQEIYEFQKNTFNLGYYTTSSKLPLPLKILYKYPVILIIIGIFILIPSIKNILDEKNVYYILYQLIYLIVGMILFISGSIKSIRKLMHKK